MKTVGDEIIGSIHPTFALRAARHFSYNRFRMSFLCLCPSSYCLRFPMKKNGRPCSYKGANSIRSGAFVLSIRMCPRSNGRPVYRPGLSCGPVFVGPARPVENCARPALPGPRSFYVSLGRPEESPSNFRRSKFSSKISSWKEFLEVLIFKTQAKLLLTSFSIKSRREAPKFHSLPFKYG